MLIPIAVVHRHAMFAMEMKSWPGVHLLFSILVLSDAERCYAILAPEMSSAISRSLESCYANLIICRDLDRFACH